MAGPARSDAVDPQAFLRAMVPYLEAFAEAEPARRLALLRESMTPDAEIWGPQQVFAGYAEISAKIEGFHRNWPGCRLVIAAGPNVFGNVARFGGAIVGPDGAPRARGESMVELAGDGRIARVVPWWEPLPPLPPDWPAHLAPRTDDRDGR